MDMWHVAPSDDFALCEQTLVVVEKTRYDVHALVDTCTFSSALSHVYSGPDTCRTVSAA